MTALKGRDIDAFVKKRDPKAVLVLIYGPDQGLVRDRAKAVGKQVVDDLNDPFNAIELTDGDLSEQGRLADEASALSFMGGERLIRIRGGADAVTKAATLLLDGITADRVKSNALVVIEAGDLKKSSGLRKLAEKSPLAVTLPCYTDSGKDVIQVIRERLGAEDIQIEDDAVLAMASQLGEDRGITQAETEKLVLFLGPKSTRKTKVTATLADVKACLTDSAADATFEVVDMALGGDPTKLSSALFRAEAAGVNAIATIRIAQGKLLRLLTVQRHIRDGDPPNVAMKKLRPPVFFGEQRSFENQLRRWPLPALELAVQEMLHTDLNAKTTGLPQREMVERTLLRLSMGAARRG